jgi:membrane associated rhomboid family serine protease
MPNPQTPNPQTPDPQIPNPQTPDPQIPKMHAQVQGETDLEVGTFDVRPKKREPIFNRMPIGVAILIGVMLAIYLLGLLIGEAQLSGLQLSFGVVPGRISDQLGHSEFVAPLVSLVGSQFFHAGALHLAMNIAMLLQAGPVAEYGFNRQRGDALRFILFFIACGIFGGLTYCWVNGDSLSLAIGASGSISGVFAGFLWAAIGMAKPGQSMLRPVLVSAAVFLLINVGLAWIARATNFLPIAWECHLGGFIAGLVLYPLFARIGRAASPV